MVPIKAIDPTSIHRITSGQVVIDLQTAVKELVENSLDAGATIIEVRFKDYGLKSIEVIDNGHGIAEDDYDNIALKHHTSKLASFEDLGTVLTFGFRGEALSSLCALSSSVAVTTATTAQAPMGTILEFERSGKVKSRSGKIARKRGTTVMVTGLFTPLPVRRKEFERNAKREYGKALTILHAYALVPCTKANKGVRLTVSNHLDKGTRSVQIRTDGSPSLKASVSTLWGPKSFENVVPLHLHLEVEVERSSVLRKRGVLQDGTTSVEVKGLISKFSPGCGRTSTDRQFFYVNGRPCTPAKVQKAFNEVYRTFNTNQMPFIVADFQLPTDTCDINVSPDKRTVFIHSENNLILQLKAQLEEAFSPSRSTFVVNSVASASQGISKSNSSATRRERESSPVTHAPPSPGQEHREADDHVTVSKDPQQVEANDTGRGRRAEEQGKIATQTNAGSLQEVFRGSQSSMSRSRSSDVAEPVGDEMQMDASSDPEGIHSQNEVNDALTLADGLPTPNATSIDVDEDIALQYDHDADSEREHDMRSTPARPRTPLFAASPPPSPMPDSGDTSIYPSNHQGNTEFRSHLSPRSSEPDDPQEHPRKRLRTSSPLSATRQSRPVQMVLGTKGAAWNLQIQHEGSTELATRGQHMSRGKNTGSSRNSIRTKLTGFAMPGSQLKPIQLDDDEVSGSTDSHGQGVPMDDKQNDEVEGSIEDVALPIPDTLGKAPQRVDEFPGRDNLSTPASELSMMDLTDSHVDDGEVSGHLLQKSSDPSMEEIADPEIIRTAASNVTLRLDLDRLFSTWSGLRSASTSSSTLPAPSSESQGLHATANVLNTDDAEGAERELARVIHKKDFASMHVLGQFNLGFIIARRVALNEVERNLGADDLFIVDQHAADEKYNFETLQQTTKIESQKLVQPRPLELTAADELVAIENLNVLRSNGFEVIIDDIAPAGHGERVKLVAQPVSKSTTFTVKDLEELLHLLQDQPSGQMVRCSKARAMFAMRACRKSVMVGKPLTIGQMTSVVRHMGTMEQPWNCPHGRPTMRHLVSLTAWHRGNKTSQEIDWVIELVWFNVPAELHLC